VVRPPLYCVKPLGAVTVLVCSVVYIKVFHFIYCVFKTLYLTHFLWLKMFLICIELIFTLDSSCVPCLPA